MSHPPASCRATATSGRLVLLPVALACLSGCEVHIGLGVRHGHAAVSPSVAKVAYEAPVPVPLARARAALVVERSRLDAMLAQANEASRLAPTSPSALDRRLRVVEARRELAALTEWLEAHPDEVPGWLADGALDLVELKPQEPEPFTETMSGEQPFVGAGDENDDAREKNWKRDPQQPSAAAPDGGGSIPRGLSSETRTAALVVHRSLTGDQVAEVERQLLQAAACVPRELAGGRVAVRGVVAAGRLVRPEVRREPPLPPALESCVLEAVRRVRLPLSQRVRGQAVEVALPSR
ncbi:MAG: hypothetical protein FJ095_06725 [Deltaproteobacteria bacterium]|nr:hypothetical protein [Deltaproteobacteria bacterium]